MNLETSRVRNWFNNFTMIKFNHLFTLRCQVRRRGRGLPWGLLFECSSFPSGQHIPAHFCLARMAILHGVCPPLATPPLLLHTSG